MQKLKHFIDEFFQFMSSWAGSMDETSWGIIAIISVVLGFMILKGQEIQRV